MTKITNAVPNTAQTHARHHVAQPSDIALPLPSLSTHHESPILIDPCSKDSLINHVLVDMLPDDVLLAIFDFCSVEWQTLVHVCRRWRTVVFGSPRHLKLRIVCTSRTPAREILDVWLALPLFIQCHDSPPKEGIENIVAMLEWSDRVCQIDIRNVSSWDLETVSVAMQVSFPDLTHLWLSSDEATVVVLPESFLGGSAPCLRSLYFDAIQFPGLLNLLLSATNLVNLDLRNIPHSGYFSPEAVVATLSMLTNLRRLHFDFQSPRPYPDWASRRLPPPTRFVLPVLSYFRFNGVSEYLEDLVARIDAPCLEDLHITFFNQTVSDTQLVQFLGRAPALKALEKASVTFLEDEADVDLTSRFPGVHVRILCIDLDGQVSSLKKVCALRLSLLSMMEDLYITEISSWLSDWQDSIENTQWMELLHPFTAVRNLYLSTKFAQRIVPALQELVGGRTTEVLPNLQNMFLQGLEPSGPIQEGIGEFIATRQVTGHPIAVSLWDRTPIQDNTVFF